MSPKHLLMWCGEHSELIAHIPSPSACCGLAMSQMSWQISCTCEQSKQTLPGQSLRYLNYYCNQNMRNVPYLVFESFFFFCANCFENVLSQYKHRIETIEKAINKIFKCIFKKRKL